MNLLEQQLAIHAKDGESYAPGHGPITFRAGDNHEALIDKWAELNGLRRSADFWLDTLSRRKAHNGAHYRNPGHHPDILGDHWPGRDHQNYFKRDRRAAAIVTEPYDGGDVDRLRVLAEQQGLVLHSPPNIYASLYYPGAALFIVITRPDFGPVQFLPDQITFDKVDA